MLFHPCWERCSFNILVWNDYCRYLTKIVGYENEWIISRLLDYWVTKCSDPNFSSYRKIKQKKFKWTFVWHFDLTGVHCKKTHLTRDGGNFLQESFIRNETDWRRKISEGSWFTIAFSRFIIKFSQLIIAFSQFIIAFSVKYGYYTVFL